MIFQVVGDIIHFCLLANHLSSILDGKLLTLAVYSHPAIVACRVCGDILLCELSCCAHDADLVGVQLALQDVEITICPFFSRIPACKRHRFTVTGKRMVINKTRSAMMTFRGVFIAWRRRPSCSEAHIIQGSAFRLSSGSPRLPRS